MQRWSEEDLAGAILEHEWGEWAAGEDGEPEGWHIVHFEAIKLSADEIAAEEARDGRPAFPPTCTVEPDWREPGEALCPERMSEKDLRKVRRRVGEFYWWALYQQRPRVREGAVFRVEWFDVVTEFSRVGAEYVRWWDFATSKETGADWTVGALLCRDAAGTYTIVDIHRGQWSGQSGERNREIRAVTEADVLEYGAEHYTVWGEQEGGSAGVDQAAAFRRLLEGYRVFTERTTGDKVVNADPLAAAAQGGNVQVRRAPWLGVFRREITDFPHGTNDDIVDAISKAYNKLARRTRRGHVPPSGSTRRAAA
jgi:phage terminase large subunit-like protein